MGAISAWFFAAWSGMLNTVETVGKDEEMQAQQVRIQELETDLNRYRSTVETQLGLLPSAQVNTDNSQDAEVEHLDVSAS